VHLCTTQSDSQTFPLSVLHAHGMKAWVFLLPTITKEDAEAYFPEQKVCQVPSGQGERLWPSARCHHNLIVVVKRKLTI